MKRNGSIMLCLLILAFPARQDSPFKELQQLSGTWKMQTGRQAIYESWKINGPNEMHGRSFVIRASDTTTLEEVRLVQSTAGLFYIPTVKDQNKGKPVSFKLVSSAGKKFIFENATHEFPQRIIYHLVSSDSVHAWIEGKNKGIDERSDYYFKRVGN